MAIDTKTLKTLPAPRWVGTFLTQHGHAMRALEAFATWMAERGVMLNASNWEDFLSADIAWDGTLRMDLSLPRQSTTINALVGETAHATLQRQARAEIFATAMRAMVHTLRTHAPLLQLQSEHPPLTLKIQYSTQPVPHPWRFSTALFGRHLPTQQPYGSQAFNRAQLKWRLGLLARLPKPAGDAPLELFRVGEYTPHWVCREPATALLLHTGLYADSLEQAAKILDGTPPRIWRATNSLTAHGQLLDTLGLSPQDPA